MNSSYCAFHAELGANQQTNNKYLLIYVSMPKVKVDLKSICTRDCTADICIKAHKIQARCI